LTFVGAECLSRALLAFPIALVCTRLYLVLAWRANIAAIDASGDVGTRLNVLVHASFANTALNIMRSVARGNLTMTVWAAEGAFLTRGETNPIRILVFTTCTANTVLFTRAWCLLVASHWARISTWSALVGRIGASNNTNFVGRANWGHVCCKFEGIFWTIETHTVVLAGTRFSFVLTYSTWGAPVKAHR
jgi:hypothetical protein